MREWKGHMTRDWLEAFENGTLERTELEKLLEHVGRCDHCAEAFADFLEEDLLSPPAYLREEILEKSRSPELQVVGKLRQTSRRMRLFLYSLKVGMAVATSVFLVFCTSRIQPLAMKISEQEMQSGSEKITEKLYEGSSRLEGAMQELTERFLTINFMEDNDE